MIDRVNLLPDSKRDKLNAKRTRQIAISITTGILAVAVGVPLLLLGIKGSQALLLNRTQGQIDQRKAELQNTPEITTMLSVKDHLNSLPPLYGTRVFTSNLLGNLGKYIPNDLSLTSIDLDTGGTMSLSGVAGSYSSVDKFYQALLYAGMGHNPDRVDVDPNTNGLFTAVVLNSAAGPSGGEVTFTITAGYNQGLIIGASSDEN